jgi:hypothetical protein
MLKPIFFAALSSLFAATPLLAQESAQQSAHLFSIQPKVATSTTFNVPIVAIPKNIRVSQAINKQIIQQIMAHLDYISVPMVTSGSIQYVVDNLATIANIDAKQGVQGLSYTVIYNKNNQLVLNIDFKHDIAIAEKHEYDLAFDLLTGKAIAITDIADLNELTDFDFFASTSTGGTRSHKNTNGNKTGFNTAKINAQKNKNMAQTISSLSTF